MKTDVLVIGAGPAGSQATYHLAKAGLDVVIVDRHAFPRDKICAGAVSLAAFSSLPFSLSDVVRKDTRQLNIIDERGVIEVKTEHKSFMLMTCRHELDDFLLKKAIEAGAKFLVVSPEFEIQQNKKDVTVTWTSSQKIECRYVIAADGANSRVRRLLRREINNKSQAFAIECCIPNDSLGNLQTFADFKRQKNGYAWGFVKDDHINLGLYWYAMNKISKSTNPKVELRNYLSKFTSLSDLAIKGAMITTFANKTLLHKKRVLFVGDAAGLSDPTFGEGIYAAIHSGQMAAKAIAENISNQGANAWRAGLSYEKKMLSFRARLLWLTVASRLMYSRIHSFHKAFWEKASRGLSEYDKT
jgi:geranylgeranyl reductase family protein